MAPPDTPPRVSLNVNELLFLMTGSFVAGVLACYTVYSVWG